jgi:hypothetical protein
MAKKIQIRRGTATDWTNFNPVLSSGELGYDITNKNFKVGDGATLWNSLAYNFITSTTLTTILGDYPTETELTTALGNYVTESALNTTLADYATTAEVGGLLSAADAMIFKGTIGTSGTITTLPTTYSAGWAYKVITAGTFAGEVCEVGDLIIAIVDREGTGNTNDDWTVVQTNLDGVVIGPASATDGNIPVYNGTSGKLIGTGYTVQTTLASSTTAIPRADAVHTAIGTVSTALGTLETQLASKSSKPNIVIITDSTPTPIYAGAPNTLYIVTGNNNKIISSDSNYYNIYQPGDTIAFIRTGSGTLDIQFGGAFFRTSIDNKTKVKQYGSAAITCISQGYFNLVGALE